MNRYRPAIEVLEDRQVPARLVNPGTLIFRDIDGDLAQVRFSRPILTPAVVNDIFQFSTGNVDGDTSTPQQLQSIRLVSILPYAAYQGTDLTVSALAGSWGDRQVNVGSLIATGMGRINIQGDLGNLQAGFTPGVFNDFMLDTLTVRSMGRYGLSTQDPSTATSVSNIYGQVNQFIVEGDVNRVQLNFYGSQDIQAAPLVGRIRIGGSLIGGSEAGPSIYSFVSIKQLVIGGDVRGGSGEQSGTIYSLFGVRDITVRGSLLGSTGGLSAAIISGTSVNRIQIGHDVRGGEGAHSASIQIGSDFLPNLVYASLSSLEIGGSIIVGAGVNSAALRTSLHFGTIRVGGSILGRADNPHDMLALGKDNQAVLGTTHLAIGALLVGGTVRNVKWNIGYSPCGHHDANATIGELRVRGNLEAARILVGSYGTKEIETQPSQIRKLIVGGVIRGLPGTIPSLIQVENVLYASVQGKPLRLNLGANNDLLNFMGNGQIIEQPNYNWPPE